MSDTSTPSPKTVLKSFKLTDGVYLLGCLEKGLTIYRQQVRALNLVWSMVNAAPKESLQRVAVVGGGFAGLTAAAGLLKKGVGHVTIFEKHAALCPLQKGSDIRWVHPRIYEWPDEESTLPTAALPILNWNAGRASDVVVEVLKGWDRLKESLNNSGQEIDEYTNVKHLRVSDKLEIEWVGEKSGANQPAANSGHRQKFSSVILAVGFGMETSATVPYWRNETLGQPELGLGRRIYLVSGHGDGGLVDLFRIRISGFRQDRILAELFSEDPELMKRLQVLKRQLDQGALKPRDLYDQFEAIAEDPSGKFNRLIEKLQARLRADTAAVLKLSPQIDSFRKVFKSSASFQNRFLLFAVYKAGGVIPYSKYGAKEKDENVEKVIRKEYGIKRADVIRRYGIDPEKVIADVLDRSLYRSAEKRIAALAKQSFQGSEVYWGGGYWDRRSKDLTGIDPDDSTKRIWRVEYLPPATELLATGLVAAVAGYLESSGACGDDFRVTLHRTLLVGSEANLQQVTAYIGRTKRGRGGEKGRAFPFDHGTIGRAAVTRKILRTRHKLKKEKDAKYRKEFQDDMERLALNEYAQRMNDEVRSVIAVPMLDGQNKYTVAVLFADSVEFNVFTNERVRTIVKMCQAFGSQLKDIHSHRLRNFPVTLKLGNNIGRKKLKVIETLDGPKPPFAEKVGYLNVEFTDFVVAEKGYAHA